MQKLTKDWAFTTKQVSYLDLMIQNDGRILIIGTKLDELNELKNYILSITHSLEGLKYADTNLQNSAIEDKEENSRIVVLSTMEYTEEKHVLYFQEKRILRALALKFNLVIEINNKRVLNFSPITIHDHLISQAWKKRDEIEKSSAHYIGSYVRYLWLKDLNPAELVAVQLAALNRGIENGGLSGWYQDGDSAVEDINTLIEFGKQGMSMNIDDFSFFCDWLVEVKSKYVTKMAEYSELDEQFEKDETELTERYLSWSNRLEAFDAFLSKLANN
ncbi:hypothetical protein [Paenibacillus tundrae]|uniref:hypothetical protein n=1 Tax=Paenibacillus tundrae TaxID=528187 RepID=UPI0022A925CF|nr:hypothetical protein [Paenibacillus tundrae]MCZ1268125.1 hypothetical protein [Paenibacillus tundrae]